MCLPHSYPFLLGEIPKKWNCKDKNTPLTFGVYICMLFYSIDKLNFLLKLNLWVWHWLVRPCRFQVHLSIPRHLSIVSCARPQSQFPSHHHGLDRARILTITISYPGFSRMISMRRSTGGRRLSRDTAPGGRTAGQHGTRNKSVGLSDHIVSGTEPGSQVPGCTAPLSLPSPTGVSCCHFQAEEKVPTEDVTTAPQKSLSSDRRAAGPRGRVAGCARTGSGPE